VIDEKEVVGRVEEFLRKVLEEENASGMVISKDGYFIFLDDSNENYLAFVDTKDLVDSYPKVFDSMFNGVERLFSDAICAAVEDVRKAYFEKYPSALLYLNREGICLTPCGDWKVSEEKESLFEIVKEVI